MITRQLIYDDDIENDWDRLVYGGKDRASNSLWDVKQRKACVRAGKLGLKHYSDPNKAIAYTKQELQILGIKRPRYLPGM